GQAHIDGIGIPHFGEIAARHFGYDADRAALTDVRAGGFGEVRVDRGIDEFKISRVVQVAVHVIVGPPRSRLAPYPVICASRTGAAHADSSSRRRWLMTVDTPSPRMDTP